MEMPLNARRFRSWIIDTLVVAGLVVFAGIVGSQLSLGKSVTSWVIVLAVGYTFLHDMVGGVSLGKRVYCLAVQTRDGQPTGFWVALARSLILYVPLLGLIDLLICLFSPEGQRLSDKILGFKVVVLEKDKFPKPSLVQLGIALFGSLLVTFAMNVENKAPTYKAPKRSYEGLTGVERLAAASYNADLQEMDRLLKEQVSPNTVDQYGSIPLQQAALSANVRAVTMLLDAGADPCLLTNRHEGGGEQVTAILKRVANHEAADPAKKPGYLQIMKLLEQRGCKSGK
jgi:uncharacterized RDD family membrane protein YckC